MQNYIIERFYPKSYLLFLNRTFLSELGIQLEKVLTNIRCLIS